MDNIEKDFKTILTSKTIWVNLLAIVCFIVQQKWGFAIDPQLQLEILSGINIGLRFLTKKPVVWR